MPRSLAAAIFLALSFAAGAQTASPSINPAVQQVQLLGPQLVTFAGSGANFESLVLGLTQATPITLTTTGTDGLVQIATFQPSSSLTPLQAAQALEAARQNLITLGIATPSAQQLATALAGGSVATATGARPLAGVLPGVTGGVQVRNELARLPSAVPGTASAGTSAATQATQNAGAAFLPPGLDPLQANQALQLANLLLAQQGIVNPTAEQLRAALQGGTITNAAGSVVTLQGVLQGDVRQANAAPPPGNLSNSPFFGTSDSPLSTAGTPNNTLGTVNVTPPPASRGAPLLRR